MWAQHGLLYVMYKMHKTFVYLNEFYMDSHFGQLESYIILPPRNLPLQQYNMLVNKEDPCCNFTKLFI